MKVIGLTGGIASGKSTAAAYLGTLGATVIDADRLGHQAYEPDTSGFRAVVAEFGEDIVGADGHIDRKALGARVFGRPEALKRLTEIVWPEIRRLAEAAIDATRRAGRAPLVVLEAAVLLEAGWEDAVDEVWVVVTDRDTAVARAMARDGADEQAIQARIDAQLTNAERAGRADVVIENSGTEDDLRRRVDAEWERVAAARKSEP